jgi:predicted permease
MPIRSRLASLWHNLIQKGRVEQELTEEVEAYLEMLVETKIKEGLQPAEARRAALIELGGVEQVKEKVREVRMGQTLETLWHDLCYGARVLVKNRRFTAVAVFTLALGIGANSAIFSVVHSVLLKPFSFAEPEQLVVAWERCLDQGLPRMVVSPPNFADWRAQNHAFQDLAAYRQQDFNLTGDGEPELVRGLRMSASMFSMLGAQPLLGRDFRADEDQPGAPPAVIISHRFWQRHFDADPKAIGQSLTLGSESATVIGVMPPGFDFPPPIAFRGEARPVQVDLWTQLRYAQENQRGAHNLSVLGRLKAGQSLEAAAADLRDITRRLATDFPDTNKGWDAFLVPLHEQVVGDVKTALLILPAAVSFVLLIACANVANLLLVRATGRQRELAIRAALGASRRRLICQLLMESLVLSLIGGIIGLLVAEWALKLVTGLAPQNIYRLDRVSLDGRVAGFTLLVSLVTAVIFGLIPAWQTSRLNLVTALKDGSAGASDGARRQVLRNLLVVAEVALAMLLLTGAGLLLRSFIRLQAVPTGFQPEQLMAMTINLPRSTYANHQQRLAFTERLMSRLTALPALQSVAFSSSLPLDTGLQGTDFRVEGRPVLLGQAPHTYVSIVSPGYFQTMGTPIFQGRDFTAADNGEAPGVVIINSHLAQQYFPGENPIGKRVDMGFRTGTLLEIVGVVADERQDTLQAEPHPGMYLPYAQSPTGLPLILLVRSAGEAGMIASAVRQQVRELDAQLPVYDVKTMDQVLDKVMARPRFMTFLLALFGALAILLAAVGIYGVVSYSVAQNTRDIGIRLALGAQGGDVLKLVLRQGLILTVCGVVIGAAGAFGLTRLMTSLLFGVTATDPLTFTGVSLLLLMVALLACYLPARRATKVDPMVALRHE